eukprot:scaffold1087_cov136-Cylindrotheca_fusiformis.AAC.13
MSPETTFTWIPSPISILKTSSHILPDSSTGMSSPRKPQHHQQPKHDEWVVPTSNKSIRAVNPVSFAFERLAKKIQPGSQRKDGKHPISLANGDPTAAGNLPSCPVAREALITSALNESSFTSYGNPCGTPQARTAIAEHHSYPEHAIDAKNVIVTNGCSGAIELALTALLDPCTVLLVPKPSYPLYQMIAEMHGATVAQYRLRKDSNWECDMDHLQELMATHHNVRAIVVNNPSSATGAVFSQLHLVQLLEFARVHRLPVVADEVFGDMTYGSSEFCPLAHIAAKLGRQVPIITTSSLSKQYLLPGWRVGWYSPVVLACSKHGSLKGLEAGANRLAQMMPGVSQLAQSIIPKFLSKSTPGLDVWKRNLRITLERQATFLHTKLSLCEGLHPFPPQGTFYNMVKIDFNVLRMDDWEFATKLLEEENIIVLPGTAIEGPRDVFRISFHLPENGLYVAANRLAQFCQRHAASNRKRMEELIKMAMV